VHVTEGTSDMHGKGSEIYVQRFLVR